MSLVPTKIRYPYSFWISICLMIVTALLSVAWHGFLFIIAVLDVVMIGCLPWLSRFEVRESQRPETDPE
jgi:xanthine/uracil permease